MSDNPNSEILALLTGLGGKIDAIEAKLGGKIDAIEAKFETIETAIIKLRTELSERIDRLSDRVATLSGGMETVLKLTDRAVALISDTNTTMTSLGSSLQRQILQLESRVATLENKT